MYGVRKPRAPRYLHASITTKRGPNTAGLGLAATYSRQSSPLARSHVRRESGPAKYFLISSQPGVWQSTWLWLSPRGGAHALPAMAINTSILFQRGWGTRESVRRPGVRVGNRRHG